VAFFWLMASKLQTLAEVPIFRQLAPDLVEEILGLCVEKTYRRGETVFMEGEPARALFVVWRGALKVFKVGDAGREQILEIEGPGRTVAELPLFDGLPYPASCAAMEDSVVLMLPAESFHRLLGREPSLARAVIAGLSQRLRHMVALVEEISLKAVRQRLAGVLLELAEDGDSVQLPWNNQEIAARIGTVREIVSRTFSRMAHEGVLRIEGRRVTILDRERL
jgi:CRP/FNR family transcriptional regulator